VVDSSTSVASDVEVDEAHTSPPQTPPSLSHDVPFGSDSSISVASDVEVDEAPTTPPPFPPSLPPDDTSVADWSPSAAAKIEDDEAETPPPPPPLPKKGSPEWHAMIKDDLKQDFERDGIDIALAPSQGNKFVRRFGLTPGGVVGRNGDLYFKSKQIAVDILAPVIIVRLHKLQELDLDDDAYLPFAQQKEVQKTLYEAWKRTQDGDDSASRVRTFARNNQDFSRNMLSQWGVVAFKMYGGLPWLNILIAWGSVPLEAVRLYNVFVGEKIRADAHREPVSDERVEATRFNVRALARAQGNPPPPPTGVNHKTSEPKRLREYAKMLGKYLTNADDKWNQGIYWSAPGYRGAAEYDRLVKDHKEL
jgi:hypothetical protein